MSMNGLHMARLLMLYIPKRENPLHTGMSLITELGLDPPEVDHSGAAM